MTEPIERARISFWWPTSGHAVWADPTRTGREGTGLWTYCFSVPFHKTLVLRKYRLMRKLGATPIAARWAVDTECQRQFCCATSAVYRYPDYEVPIGSPMAFFPPEPCAICGEFDHDEWDDNAHPSEGDDYE